MTNDADLLRRYVERRDQSAFGKLVERHLPIVFAAALRRVGGRTHLAEEISQKVFSDLARKAPSLIEHPALIAWLYRSTRYAAIDAIRAERRQTQLAQSLTAMHDSRDSNEESVKWEDLRPVLDAAMDDLNEGDREIMLLRFFNGLTFAEVGERLSVAENTARMRTERALERLGRRLRHHGITSTSTALGLLLANSAVATAPSGLVAAVTAGAIAHAPANLATALTSVLLMSKITTPLLVAALAAGITLIAYKVASPGVSSSELAALKAENARLAETKAAHGRTSSTTAESDEFAARAAAIARAVDQKHSPSTSTGPTSAVSGSRAGAGPVEEKPSGHRNRGQATPHDAFMSFAWANDAGDITATSKLIWFDEDVRPKALAVLASMPASLRAQYPTPEELYAFFFAADALVAPAPGADVIERFEVVELRPGRTALRAPGTDRNFQEYQLTADGWKWAVPAAGVEHAPEILKNETLAKLVPR